MKHTLANMPDPHTQPNLVLKWNHEMKKELQEIKMKEERLVAQLEVYGSIANPRVNMSLQLQKWIEEVLG